MAMKIDVDIDLCQGHAVCAMEAPDVFRVPKGSSGRVEVINDSPGEELREQVEDAISYCPTQALRIIETSE